MFQRVMAQTESKRNVDGLNDETEKENRGLLSVLSAVFKTMLHDMKASLNNDAMDDVFYLINFGILGIVMIHYILMNLMITISIMKWSVFVASLIISIVKYILCSLEIALLIKLALQISKCLHFKFCDIPSHAKKPFVSKKFDNNARKKFLKQSADKKEKLNHLPSITKMEEEQKDAHTLTEQILSHKSTDRNLNDRSTLLNILGNISKNNGRNVLFYDSKQTKLSNPATAKELKFTLNLNTFEQKVENEVNTVMEIKSCIESKANHPILADFKQRLSKVYNVGMDKIKIIDIFSGTINVTYVIDIAADKLEEYYNENIQGEQAKLEEGLQAVFDQYKDCKIHALLFRDSFDINWFDEGGNKTFSSGSTFKVGPKGRELTYTQPSGWVRFGLKVLDGVKYGADHSWLTPFQDPGNWYRCYHGTGSSGTAKGKNVDVMAWIHSGGFHYANNTAYGPGVYCSPEPVWLEGHYAGTHTLNGKTYKFMLQCAANPNGVRIYNDPHCGVNWQGGSPWGPIWVANTPQDIRPYAVLIKEC